MSHARGPRPSSSSASSASSKKRRRLSSTAVPSAAATPSSKKSLSLRDLKWKGVAVPSQSLSLGAGKRAGLSDEVDETEADEDDPFADLDEGADDFMGLQEVSGVGIRYQGNEKTGRTVEFYATSEPSTGTADVAPSQTSKSKSKAVEKAQTGEAKTQGLKAQGEKKSNKETPASITAAEDEPASADDQEEEAEEEEEEEEEWKPVESDDDQDEPEEAEGNESNEEAIPEGIFSSFVGDLPEDGDLIANGEELMKATFNSE